MSTKSTKTSARSTKEPAMKTEKKPAPKATTKPAAADKKPAKKGAAPVVEPATEQARVSDFTAAAAITSAAAIATSDPDAEIEAVHEAAMKAARSAVERGADANACSDAVAAYAAGAIDKAEFHARLETAVPVASNAAVDAPAADPAPVDAATTDDAPVANTDPTDAAVVEQPSADATATEQPAPNSDARDMILARLATLDPAARRAMLEGYSKQELHALVERATGTKTSGRLSPASAIERILTTLTTEGPKADAQPTTAQQPGNERPPATAITTSTRGRAAELPPVGTVLTNTDRHGQERVRCVVVEGGVEYAGQKYTSLSAAAIVASRDLGNQTKQTSGPRFWGLLAGTPRAPKATKGLDLDVIGRAWDKYRERAEAAAKSASDEDKAKLHALLGLHSTALSDLAAAVA